jgi:metallo-beta-lactamase family protein
MKISFIGGTRTVTGSSFLISTDSANVLVDCGMFQGRRDLVARNYLEAIYDPRDIDALVLTHAHIDHSGLIPKLVKDGFSGRIYATRATTDLCGLMLADSAHIQEMESRWRTSKNRRRGLGEAPPLYTVKDAERAMTHFEPVTYDRSFSPAPGIDVIFRDAGHILGSGMAELWAKTGGGKIKLVFSGDVGTSDQPIIRDPSVITEADFLFIESTYGNRLHKTIEQSKEEFTDALLSTVGRGGKVIIPSFAVGRTQEIIYYLAELYRQGKLPEIPVIVDSPMATSATQIIKNNPDCFDEDINELMAEGKRPLDMPTLKFTRSTEESMAINTLKGSAVIISSSGMCDGGRIKHHLRHNLWRPETTVIFVGFQAEGTLGRRIVNGDDTVRILGEEIQVNAKIYTINGLSAHADREGLLDWASHFRGSSPMTFVVHGEERAAFDFARTLTSELSLNTYVPDWGETLELSPDKTYRTLSVTEAGEKIGVFAGKFKRDLAYIKDKIARIEKSGIAGKQDVSDRLGMVKSILSEIEEE